MLQPGNDYKEEPRQCKHFGNGKHFISYEVSEQHSGFYIYRWKKFKTAAILPIAGCLTKPSKHFTALHHFGLYGNEARQQSHLSERCMLQYLNYS